MKPAAFDYHRPSTVADAVGLLATIPDAKPIAGGQSLMPMLNMRLAQPAALVDLGAIESLSFIRRDNGELVVGATTTQRTLERSPEAAALPLIGAVIRHIGHPTIRNRGTVGGSIAHADPAAELPVLALALDAQLQIEGAGGSRTVPADAFFRGFLTTAVDDGELLIEVRFTVPPTGTGFGFQELARRHGDFALASVLSLVTLRDDGTVSSARIVVGGAGPAPVRVTAAEQQLLGQAPSAEVIAGAAAAVGPALQPVADVHASADYRRQVASVLTRRTLQAAVTQLKEHAL